MTRHGIDGDEFFTLHVAGHDLGGLFAEALRDLSHPPLFYLLVKAWAAVGGDGLLWLRLLPVGLSVATLLPIHLCCRRLGFRPWETAFAVTLAGANAFVVSYAQYLRMFVLLQLFAAWSLWLFLRLRDPDARPGWRFWAGFAAVNLGMVWSHYWGWVFLGSELLALLLVARRHLPAAIASMLVVAAGFAPWAVALSRAAAERGAVTAQISWIGKPSPGDAVWFVADLAGRPDIPGGAKLGLALFALPLAAYAGSLVRTRSGWRPAVALTVLTAAPVAVTFAASHLLPQSVWAPRQLVISAIPFHLLVALAAFRVWWPRPIRVLVPVALAGWAIAAGAADKFGPDTHFQWEPLLRGIAEREPGGEPVAVYMNESHFVPLAEFHARRLGLGGRVVPKAVDDSFADVAGNHFWVIYRDKVWKGSVPPEQLFRDRGHRTGDPLTSPIRTQTLFAVPVWRP